MYHYQHLAIDRAFLGKEFPHVHKILDNPRFLFGKKHRKVNHNICFCMLIGRMYGLLAYYSALLHLICDGVEVREV